MGFKEDVNLAYQGVSALLLLWTPVQATTAVYEEDHRGCSGQGEQGCYLFFFYAAPPTAWLALGHGRGGGGGGNVSRAAAAPAPLSRSLSVQ